MSRNPSYEDLTRRIETLEREVAERQKTEQALRKSERRFRTLLDFVPYPIAVFDADSRVSYLNPEFTKVFGWSLKELKGKIIPFVPKELKRKTAQEIRRLFHDKILQSHVTRRQTKGGRMLDVASKAAVFTDSETGFSEVLAIHRDVTRERRVALNNEAMLRISLALPKYPNLGDLMDYITEEIKRMLRVEGAIVLLLDEEKSELFTLSAAYDDKARQRRMMEVRFPTDKLISGKVIKSGNPIIVSDTSVEPELHEERDRIMGYKTLTLLAVPLIVGERIIGTLSAVNKKEGLFDRTDEQILSMIASTVALSIENARVTDELHKAYSEVSSLNRAKGKAINHLSHELRTPVAILSGSLKLFEEYLKDLPEDTWKSTMGRTKRNLERLMEIQYEVNDIMLDRGSRTHDVLTMIFEQCGDELETLIAEETGEGEVVQKVRQIVEERFGLKKLVPEKVDLANEIGEKIKTLKPRFAHRDIRLEVNLESVDPISIPLEVLHKVFEGLLKNAVENTPDEGKIEISVKKVSDGAELVIRDCGVGILEEDQRRIFEGFFVTQDTMAYSSKRPYDFNAGGKGADLLRIKIFSERYGFKIGMKSERRPCLAEKKNACPGRISECNLGACGNASDSGGTAFSVHFPSSTP